WLSRASSWAKFTATAALGVIHNGQIKHGFDLLQPYLPLDNTSSSPFSEGGAFFALGLIHACHGTEKVTSYLQDALVTYQGQNAEILQHGACLGLGAAGMGSGSEEMSRALMNVLYSDSAVSGEAAALALGMVMMGSRHEATVRDMLVYAKETEHEKIIRALSLGIGLVMFGRKQEADALIERLLEEKDALLRLGAVHAITMAYCGTGDNAAIRRLLHLAVSDVKDDVRRAAVTGLGFILLRSPEQVPRMVELLSESFNPHVRVGSALALGIACAGTGSPAAVAILEPMLKDAVDFVVEGASIALAFILMQQNEAYEPKVAEVRRRYAEIIETKNAEVVSKFGAAMSQGIIDAGGRNVTIGLTTAAGQLSAPACGGMLLFTQFWSWFPLGHFLALALRPTALIAVNGGLRAPVLEATCSARKQLFAYPAKVEQAVVQAPTKIATAILSTTAKVKRSAAASGKSAGEETAPAGVAAEASEKDDEEEGSGMDVDESGSKKSASAATGKKAVAVDAPFGVGNMTRLLPYQEKYMKWPSGSRYVPVKGGRVTGGVTVVRDTRAGEAEELIPSALADSEDEAAAAAQDAAGASATGGEEAAVPEAFEYPFGSEQA
ncbi:proteasome regulatory particle base subunit, partial [Coemansia sp. RSA 2703]